MNPYHVLLAICAFGCIGLLANPPRGSVRELVFAVLALAPILAMPLVGMFTPG